MPLMPRALSSGVEAGKIVQFQGNRIAGATEEVGELDDFGARGCAAGQTQFCSRG